MVQQFIWTMELMLLVHQHFPTVKYQQDMVVQFMLLVDQTACFAGTFTNNYTGLAGGAIGSYNAYTRNIASLNSFQDNTTQEDPDVYTASFSHLGPVSNKIGVFTSYLNRLSKNFDRESEPDVRSTIIYVDNSVAESGDGRSWSGAVQTIGMADCEIWVSGGLVPCATIERRGVVEHYDQV